MFDYIKVEVQVPFYGTNHEFQTKAFVNAFEHYVITAKGELYIEHWDYEWIEDETKLPLKGYMHKKEGTYRREYLTDYHGDVIFYDDYNLGDFIARFSYGRLDRLTFKARERLNDTVLQQHPTIWEQDSSQGDPEW